jgi:CHAT domain-containing protein/tetratricopeptide (TPR) repeat protein
MVRWISRGAWLVMLIAVFVVTASAQETAIQEATRLQDEAQQLMDGGRYQEGIEMAERAVARREALLGKEHLDVAVSLHTLGRLHAVSGHYDLSQLAHQRALALREKVLGAEHQDTAASLVHLGGTYYLNKEHSKAEPLYQRALSIFEKTLGPDHVETSKATFGLASVLSETVAYERAELLFKRALTVRERVAGAESVQVAKVLNNLGNMYFSMGLYQKSRVLSERTLAIREKVSGPEHPETTVALANLAAVHAELGDYANAEALYRRALALQEKALGVEHTTTAATLGGIALVYARTGAHLQAEAFYRRAIAIQRKAQGAAATALYLHNLGDLYSTMGLPEQAVPVLREALDIAEKNLGTKDSQTSILTASLGNAYRRLGDYDQATTLLQRAVTLTQIAAVPEHSSSAKPIISLADLYTEVGAYAKALPLYRRAVAIHEKALGAENLVTASALRALAKLHWARRESQTALALLQRVQRIETRQGDRLLSAGSEARKQDYLRIVANDTYDDVSFAMSMPQTAATELGMVRVLQHKGRVLDVMSDSVARIRRSVAPADHLLLEQLADVASQLSSLTYGQGGNLSPKLYQKRLAQLSARQEQLETDLARRSQAFGREVTPVTLENVKRGIPANAVLVEWLRYTPFDPRNSPKAGRGAARYVAYVLKHSGAPMAVDVGEAQAIEGLARRLSLALADPTSKDVKRHSAALSAKLLTPLRVHLRGAEHILFSPDGELHLVPMAALLDESGAYLAERFDVSYLTSGRDLLRITTESRTRTGAVVMADPSYGKRDAALASTGPTLQPRRSADLDRSGLLFRPLAGTALEAQDLRTLLKLDDASVLLRHEASESRLKRLKGPRILHIASHGFFLSDQQLNAEMSKRRRSSSALPAPSENPLLRSGIALAGANERSSGDDDGILTALEAMQLDLSGTELVVLSACDSGVGEVQNGEGVYGLRRALALAGAQTQVTSLWKVPDDATRHLMADYYRRLLQGEGRSAALRSTQRGLMGSATLSHPYYWASFIAIGNWNALPMK